MSEYMNLLTFVGFVSWVLGGLLVVAHRTLVLVQEFRRQRTLLKCEIWNCKDPADVVWVGRESVHGLCDWHYEQEEKDDGEEGREAREEGNDSHRADPGGDEPDAGVGRD